MGKIQGCGSWPMQIKKIVIKELQLSLLVNSERDRTARMMHGGDVINKETKSREAKMRYTLPTKRMAS